MMVLEKLCPSGLWHHSQRSGQPFKNIVVLIPGPSKTENSSIEKTNASAIFPLLSVLLL
jgi:hypothetical protein